MNRNKLFLAASICLLCLSTIALGQPTDADVGDVASFGKEAKFFGFAQSGVVVIARDCSTIPVGPDGRCYTISPTTNGVVFDARDIGRIHFPKDTFQQVMYMLSRHQFTYVLTNTTTQNKTARFLYRPYTTLVSDVLNDPSLINPQTGLPFAGKMDISNFGSRSFTKTLFPNYQEIDTVAYGSTSLSGVTKKFVMDNYGLSQQVVDDLFYAEFSILLNVQGSAINVDQANFSWGARFIGN